jgi:hypothetical protein
MSRELSHRTNVAPILGDDKAHFVARQLASTLSGGIKVKPGMTAKAYILQFALWLTPPTLGAGTAFGLGGKSALTRFLVAGGAAAVFVSMVDFCRWYFCRRSRDDIVHHNLWFADEDDVDYSSLLSPATLRSLLPSRRSKAHVAFGISLSSILVGVSASVLDIDSLEQSGIPSAVAPLLSILCLVTVATAQFGLTSSPPLEVTSHRYFDPLTLSGLAEDYSRPLLVVLLLTPVLLDLPDACAAGLCIFAALLPVLWTTGVVPQLDVLIYWFLDQLEVHLFGGSPMPRELRLVAAVVASSLTATSMALVCEAGRGISI